MENYEILINNPKLNLIIDSINEKNKDVLLACHGRYHTTFVVNTIEYILNSLGYNSKMIELGKIAGLLHDIGTLNGKKGHAIKSSEMCKMFLDKTHLSHEDKNIIIEAIANHSNGEHISSPVGAALLIADKIDISKNRVLELGRKDFWHSNLLNIEQVQLSIEESKIIINYLANDNFSEEILLSEWQKGFLIPVRASEYLGCGCIYQINGETIDLIEKMR